MVALKVQVAFVESASGTSLQNISLGAAPVTTSIPITTARRMENDIFVLSQTDICDGAGQVFTLYK